jgi:cell division protein FtsW (lipid II flippase)
MDAVQIWRRTPKLLLASAVSLALVGWLSIRRAEQFIDAGNRFSGQQLVWNLLAAAALVIAVWPDYRRLARLSYVALAVAMVLLASVYWFPPINGAHRWIRIGPFGVQPSELAKLAFVLALARYLSTRQNYRRLIGLALPLSLACFPVLLILKEPDLGTALVFPPVLLCMLAAAGARLRHLVLLTLVALALSPVLWSEMSREQRSRVAGLLNQSGPGEKPDDDGYQLHQSKQMLALGGLQGSLLAGDAVSDPSVYHLPEAHTDFVFSVLGERLGLWGNGCVLLLYSVLVLRGLAIAAATQEPFGRLVAVGVSALLGVQVLINTGMTVGLLPVTGLSLPLVSYGGSSMLATALSLGLLVNIALHPSDELAAEPFRFRN